MSVVRLIWLCVAVLCVILAGGIMTAFRLPANIAFAFSVFGAMLISIFFFALRVAVEDKRRHVD
jgi:hypothetical protein